MYVREIMTRPVETVEPETSLLFVARQMKDKGIGCVPVADNGILVGIVTDRDIVCRGVAASGDLSELRARDVMTTTVFFCSEGEQLSEAVRVMIAQRIYHLPVADRGKHLVGMLALGDIALREPTFLGQAVKPLVARDAGKLHPETPSGKRDRQNERSDA